MASITDAQIDEAIPNVPAVEPVPYGQPRRDRTNELFKKLRDKGNAPLVSERLRAGMAAAKGRNPYDLKGQAASEVSLVTVNAGAYAAGRTYNAFDAGGYDVLRVRGAPYRSGFAGYPIHIVQNTVGSINAQNWSAPGVKSENLFGILVYIEATCSSIQIITAGLAYTSNIWPIWVNGKKPTFAAATVNNGGRIQLDFAARDRYQIIVALQQSGRLAGVSVPEDDIVHAITDKPLPIPVLGDSYIQGSVSPATNGDPCLIGAMNMIGGVNCIPLGVTDTGYATPAGVNYPFDHAERVQNFVDVINASSAPLACVIGGTNDVGKTAAQVQTGAANIINAVLANTSANLVLFGAQPRNLNNSAALQSVDAGISAAVVAADSPRVVYAPVSAAVPPWYTGTRSTSVTSGGVAGYSRYVMGTDNVHLSPSFTAEGTEFYARRTLETLLAVSSAAGW